MGTLHLCIRVKMRFALLHLIVESDTLIMILQFRDEAPGAVDTSTTPYPKTRDHCILIPINPLATNCKQFLREQKNTGDIMQNEYPSVIAHRLLLQYHFSKVSPT